MNMKKNHNAPKTIGLPKNYQPTAEEVKRYLESWEQQPKYHVPQDALDKLFRETYKTNDCLEEVLVKCSALNNLYSTNIFDVYSMANHIWTLKIDERLQKGDYSLVKCIADLEINGKKRHFYSFASKYCCHHFPEFYAIYDSYVEKVLLSINRSDENTRFASFTKEGLKDYDTLMSVIHDFRDKFHLTQFSIRQLDHYLWQLGKTYFNEN